MRTVQNAQRKQVDYVANGEISLQTYLFYLFKNFYNTVNASIPTEHLLSATIYQALS